MIEVLKSKIHRATVTDANLNYDGSITIAPELITAAMLNEYQKVTVVNLNNGARFDTYVIRGMQRGEICINGAAARLACAGDKIIIMAYHQIDEAMTGEIKPVIVPVDDENKVRDTTAI